MRLLPTAALILASLALSVGGVVARSHADASNQSVNLPAANAADECPAPVQPGNVRIPKATLGKPEDVIVLNTRGFNYPLPGETSIDPMRGVKPFPAYPASPAKP